MNLATLSLAFLLNARSALLDKFVPRNNPRQYYLVGMHDRKSPTRSLIGVSESQLREAICSNKVSYEGYMQSVFSLHGTQENPIYFIKNPQTGHSFQAGYVKEVSISEIRKFFDDNPPAKNEGGISFFLLKNADIGAIQAHPFFEKKTAFQVASNFNLLEGTDYSVSPDNFGLDNYYNDNTQGPKACLSAFPGAFFRTYGIFAQQNLAHYLSKDADAKSPLQWRQSRDQQINLLRNTAIPVENGYIRLYKLSGNSYAFSDVLENIQKAAVKEKYVYDLLGAMNIGFHRDIQVLFGNQSEEIFHQALFRRKPIIHQVFMAALDLGSANRWLKQSNLDLISDDSFRSQFEKYADSATILAKALLHAGYEGAIGAACMHGAEKIVLTQIGGGVFENDKEWIQSAILDVLKKYKNFRSLQVYLNIYGKNDKDVDELINAYVEKAQENGIGAKKVSLESLQAAASQQSAWRRFLNIFSRKK